MRRFDEPPPRAGHTVQRRLAHVGLTLVLNLPEKVPGIEQRLTRLNTLKRDGPQEGRQKTSHARVALDEFLVIVVVGRPSQLFDGRTGCKETVARYPCKGVGAYLDRLDGLIQEDLQGVPQLYRGAIQVMERAESLRFPLFMRAPDDVTHQAI